MDENAMTYDGERAKDGFRRQCQLAEALYRENLKSLGKTTQALLTHHQVVALWSVYAYLAALPVAPTRQDMLAQLRALRSGPRRERLQSGVARDDWYAGHRDTLLAHLIERFEREADAPPLLDRNGRLLGYVHKLG
jgi:hypothetical protein